MKQFFVSSKVSGVLVALCGVALAYYVWAFWYDTSILLDLITPKLWEAPLLDWLITFYGIGFCFLAYVYALGEGRTWKNAAYATPLFLLNSVTVATWWSMERGNTSVEVACLLLTIVVLINLVYSSINAFRRFELPAIQL